MIGGIVGLEVLGKCDLDRGTPLFPIGWVGLPVIRLPRFSVVSQFEFPAS